jgi:hypothetical protein
VGYGTDRAQTKKVDQMIQFSKNDSMGVFKEVKSLSIEFGLTFRMPEGSSADEGKE